MKVTNFLQQAVAAERMEEEGAERFREKLRQLVKEFPRSKVTIPMPGEVIVEVPADEAALVLRKLGA